MYMYMAILYQINVYLDIHNYMYTNLHWVVHEDCGNRYLWKVRN